MGQPPSDQAFKCRVMLFVATSMNLAASGMIGFEPLVRVLSMSEGSPVPILKKRIDTKRNQYESSSLSLFPMILPVVRSHVDLVSRAAQQILQSVLLNGGADLRRVPVAEFRFVVDRVSMDRCVVGRMGSHFHRQRVGRGGGEGDLRRVRRS